MALLSNPTASGGEIIPIIKFDARAGQFFRIDRHDGVNNPVMITSVFKAVFDFENVEVGYINFTTGGAPDFHLVAFGNPMPAQPTQAHKQGFRVLIKLGAEAGGDVREFAATSGAAVRAINNLHDMYLAMAPQYPGKLPVVIMRGIAQVTSQGQGQKSTNYEPIFEIVGWAPRPADLKASPRGLSAPAAAPVQQQPQMQPVQQYAPQPMVQPAPQQYVQQPLIQPPQAGAQRVGAPQMVSVAPPQQVAPPPVQQAPQPAMAMEEDFG